jgi:hypothetical protein
VLAVDDDVPLLQVPAARPHEEGRDLVVQRVPLVALLERDRPLDRVGEVLLAADDVLPGRRVRVLEVGHVHARARVERVDHHLPVARGPGDLDPAVLQVGRDGRDPPLALANPARGLEEVGQLARLDPLLPSRAGAQELLAPAVELAVQRDDEVERLGREDTRLVGRGDGDGLGDAHGTGAASNCASSVEPLSASVELSPPLTASRTASK